MGEAIGATDVRDIASTASTETPPASDIRIVSQQEPVRAPGIVRMDDRDRFRRQEQNIYGESPTRLSSFNLEDIQPGSGTVSLDLNLNSVTIRRDGQEAITQSFSSEDINSFASLQEAKEWYFFLTQLLQANPHIPEYVESQITNWVDQIQRHIPRFSVPEVPEAWISQDEGLRQAMELISQPQLACECFIYPAANAISTGNPRHIETAQKRQLATEFTAFSENALKLGAKRLALVKKGTEKDSSGIEHTSYVLLAEDDVTLHMQGESVARIEFILKTKGEQLLEEVKTQGKEVDPKKLIRLQILLSQDPANILQYAQALEDKTTPFQLLRSSIQQFGLPQVDMELRYLQKQHDGKYSTYVLADGELYTVPEKVLDNQDTIGIWLVLLEDILPKLDTEPLSTLLASDEALEAALETVKNFIIEQKLQTTSAAFTGQDMEMQLLPQNSSRDGRIPADFPSPLTGRFPDTSELEKRTETHTIKYPEAADNAEYLTAVAKELQRIEDEKWYAIQVYGWSPRIVRGKEAKLIVPEIILRTTQGYKPETRNTPSIHFIQAMVGEEANRQGMIVYQTDKNRPNFSDNRAIDFSVIQIVPLEDEEAINLMPSNEPVSIAWDAGVDLFATEALKKLHEMKASPDQALPMRTLIHDVYLPALQDVIHHMDRMYADRHIGSKEFLAKHFFIQDASRAESIIEEFEDLFPGLAMNEVLIDLVEQNARELCRERIVEVLRNHADTLFSAPLTESEIAKIDSILPKGLLVEQKQVKQKVLGIFPKNVTVTVEASRDSLYRQIASNILCSEDFGPNAEIRPTFPSSLEEAKRKLSIIETSTTSEADKATLKALLLNVENRFRQINYTPILKNTLAGRFVEINADTTTGTNELSKIATDAFQQCSIDFPGFLHDAVSTQDPLKIAFLQMTFPPLPEGTVAANPLELWLHTGEYAKVNDLLAPLRKKEQLIVTREDVLSVFPTDEQLGEALTELERQSLQTLPEQISIEGVEEDIQQKAFATIKDETEKRAKAKALARKLLVVQAATRRSHENKQQLIEQFNNEIWSAKNITQDTALAARISAAVVDILLDRWSKEGEGLADFYRETHAAFAQAAGLSIEQCDLDRPMQEESSLQEVVNPVNEVAIQKILEIMNAA